MPGDSVSEQAPPSEGRDEVAFLLRCAGLPASDDEIDKLVEVYGTALGMARQMYATRIEGEIG